MNLQFFVLALSILLYVEALAVDDHDPYWFNLALNKTTSQSTTAAGGEASLAVDGNTEGSCTLTEAATSNWFAIDFGRSVYLSYFVVYVNGNFDHVFLRIGDSDVFSSNPALLSRSISISQFKTQFNWDKKGRYLSIHHDSSPAQNQLSICEVFAYLTPLDSVSYGKPVEAIEKPDVKEINNHPPQLVNDFNWNSYCWSAHLPNSWIRIDLLDVHFVREVIIAQYASSMFNEFLLAIGSSLKDEGRANPRCPVTDLRKGEAKSFRCGLKGRYVVLATARAGNVVTKASEIVVNPSDIDNLAEGIQVDFSAAEAGFDRAYGVTDLRSKTAIVTKDTGSGHWIRIDLGNSYPVATILLLNIKDVEYKTMMAAFELRVGDSDADNGNSNPLCLPGVHSLVGKQTESYFCVPRVTGRYVNIRQADNPVAVTEVAVYSEFRPKIEREKDPEIWRKMGVSSTVLTCVAHGYPAPDVSWQKDGVLLSSTHTLTVKNHFNESGTYECWANNTHGQTLKTVDFSITSDLRVCVGSIEVTVDAGGTNVNVYPKAEQTFLGHKWYRFSDITSRQYLKMDSKTPNLNICQTKLSGNHPGLSDGVIERNVCVRDELTSCQRKYKVRMRNCGAYYVYNFPSRHEARGFNYCFSTVTKPSGSPSIASMVGGPNSALSNHILQREEDIPDSTDCLLMCTVSKKCKSFNFNRKEKICELNSSSKKISPKDFVSRTGFNYFARGKGMVTRQTNEL